MSAAIFEPIRDVSDGCTLSLRVHPGAKQSRVTGIHNGALKLSLTAPAVDGRANEALIAYLADQLGVPRTSISLVQGATSRSKTVRITGMTSGEVSRVLWPDLAV